MKLTSVLILKIITGVDILSVCLAIVRVEIYRNTNIFLFEGDNDNRYVGMEVDCLCQTRRS